MSDRRMGTLLPAVQKKFFPHVEDGIQKISAAPLVNLSVLYVGLLVPSRRQVKITQSTSCSAQTPSDRAFIFKCAARLPRVTLGCGNSCGPRGQVAAPNSPFLEFRSAGLLHPGDSMGLVACPLAQGS